MELHPTQSWRVVCGVLPRHEHDALIAQQHLCRGNIAFYSLLTWMPTFFSRGRAF